MRARSAPRSQRSLKPTIRIGKKGITDEQLKEILKQLEARETVKIQSFKISLSR